MVEPWYRPAPKSGCTGVLAPMKLMIASELGSTAALKMFWFHALSDGKGMKPFRLAPRPRLMPLHGLCAYSGEQNRIVDRIRRSAMRRIRTSWTAATSASYHRFCTRIDTVVQEAEFAGVL